MKARVVSVSEAGFKGTDGPVPGASLTFLDEGGAEKTLIGYGPSMTNVLSWKEGESHEIEVFRPDGKDKDRFRLPREQKSGFGGGAAAYRNTKEGQLYEQDQMTIRTALMQSVATVDALLKAGAKPDGDIWTLILRTSDNYLTWLRAKANGR